MDTEHPPQPPAGLEPGIDHSPAAEHVSGARDLLKTLRQRVGEHPELGEAITELEMALSILTVKTAGML